MCENDRSYAFLKEWLSSQLLIDKNVKLSIDNFIFVAGNTGIGKTYNVQKICRDLNLHVINITTSNCSTSAELRDNLVKSMTSSLLQVLTNDTKQRVIVIDEFESMMSMDRTINSTLLAILTENKLRMLPIICISSLEILKKIGTLKKKCKIVELNDISESDVFDILKLKYPEKDAKYLKMIASKSQCNISQSFQRVDNQYSDHNFDNIDEILNINMLYGQAFNREHLTQIVMTDQWLIPLRFHENLISELKQRKITIKASREFYKNFMNNLIIFDVFMCNNNTNIASDMFASLVYPLTLIPMKKKAKSNISNFTKILSYLSLQKKYTKKSYSNNFPLYQLSNYHINIAGRNYMFFN